MSASSASPSTCSPADAKVIADQLTATFGHDSNLVEIVGARVREIVTLTRQGVANPGIPVVCEDDLVAEIVGVEVLNLVAGLCHTNTMIRRVTVSASSPSAEDFAECSVLTPAGLWLTGLTEAAELPDFHFPFAFLHALAMPEGLAGDYGWMVGANFRTTGAYQLLHQRMPSFTSRHLANPLVIEPDDIALATMAAAGHSYARSAAAAMTTALADLRRRPGFDGLASLRRLAVLAHELGTGTAQERLLRAADAHLGTATTLTGPKVVRSPWDEVLAMVGIESVIERIDEIAASARLSQARVAAGKPALFTMPHLVLTGSPGTGKTTAAQAIGMRLHGCGALAKPDVHVVSRGDLIGSYVGESIPKLRAAIEAARGGILFIDEAYGLVNGDSSKDYGHEVLTELLRYMEEGRGDICVIFAGYPDEMEAFLDLNPGLRSRVADPIVFPDLTAAQMTEVVRRLAAANELAMAPGADDAFEAAFRRTLAAGTPGSGRIARQAFERAVAAMARRGCADESTDLVELELTAADVAVARPDGGRESRPMGFAPSRPVESAPVKSTPVQRREATKGPRPQRRAAS